MLAKLPITPVLSEKEAAALYRRLTTLAAKNFRASKDDAHDAASHAITMMIRDNIHTFQYGAAIVRNFFYLNWRHRLTRPEVSGYDFSADGEANETLSTIPPIQELTLYAKECVVGISSLPPDTRDVMVLVAQQYEADEICTKLNMKKREVYGRTQEGRQVLRDRDYYDIGRKRGYIGVQKDGRKWYASIRKDRVRRNLGSYTTAIGAALAYDKAAKEMHGPGAILNFPISDGPSTGGSNG